MEEQVINQTHLVELLKSCRFNKDNVNISVTGRRYQGVIHVRNGAAISAHAGLLHGNGALLSLVQLRDSKFATESDDSSIQKTVFLNLDQIVKLVNSQKRQPTAEPAHDEEKLLVEAKTLLFRFHYKESVDRLVTILRQNRFFYPAWLWQSRLLTRQDYISRALDEAYRWGNHDQDVWREARKMRPQLNPSDEPIKRCIFCWSILDNPQSCPYCKARFAITAMQPSPDLKEDDIRLALTYFEQAKQQDPQNARTTFALALGYFNLKKFSRALGFMEAATKLAPNTPLYTKSLSLLQTIVKADRAIPPATARKAPVPGDKSIQPTILMIEDSMTSRKVLAMLLKRFNLKVLEAGTGAEALQIAAKEHPQLVLLDLMLPDTNGHDLLAKLRQFDHLSEVPVIMLTGRHDTKDRLRGMQGGAQEYVTKPFNPQKLTELIQSYLKVKKDTPRQSPKPVVPKTRPQSDRKPNLRYDRVSRTAPPLSTPELNRINTQRQEPVPSPPASTSSKTIFVIEDSRTSRKVLTMLLTRNGYKFHEAASGKEALDLAPSITPDLVLLDVMLPDTTGYTILPKLRELPHYEKLPFIMLTGNRKATDRLQGMLAGTNEYLTKPFNPQKLLTIIKNYL